MPFSDQFASAFWTAVLATTLPIGVFEVVSRRVARVWGRRASAWPARLHGLLLLVLSAMATVWILLLTGVAHNLGLSILPEVLVATVLALFVVSVAGLFVASIRRARVVAPSIASDETVSALATSMRRHRKQLLIPAVGSAVAWLVMVGVALVGGGQNGSVQLVAGIGAAFLVVFVAGYLILGRLAKRFEGAASTATMPR